MPQDDPSGWRFGRAGKTLRLRRSHSWRKTPDFTHISSAHRLCHTTAGCYLPAPDHASAVERLGTGRCAEPSCRPRTRPGAAPASSPAPSCLLRLLLLLCRCFAARTTAGTQSLPGISLCRTLWLCIAVFGFGFALPLGSSTRSPACDTTAYRCAGWPRTFCLLCACTHCCVPGQNSRWCASVMGSPAHRCSYPLLLFHTSSPPFFTRADDKRYYAGRAMYATDTVRNPVLAPFYVRCLL